MINAQLVKELREMTGAGMMDCKKALVATNGNIDEAVTWLRENGIAKAVKKVDRIAAEGVCAIAIKGNDAVVYEVNSETDFVAKNQQFKDLANQIGEALLTKKVNSDEEALEVEYNGQKVADLLVNATATIGEKITLRRVKQFTKEDDQVFGAYSHMNGKIASFAILQGANAEVAKDVCMHVAAMSPRYLNVDAVDPETVAKETEIFRQEALNENAEAAKPKPEAIIEKMVAGRVQKYLKEICLENQQFVKNPDLTVEQYVSNAKGKILTYIRLEVGEGIEKRKDDFAAEVMAAIN